MATTNNLPYTPLSDPPVPDCSNSGRRRPIKCVSYPLLLSALIVLIFIKQGPKRKGSEITNTSSDDLQESYDSSSNLWEEPAEWAPLEETSRSLSDEKEESYPWTNAMLSWQRTGYHFQPLKNWMNG